MKSLDISSRENLLLRALLAERFGHFAGIIFARPENSVSEILNTHAPDLLWTVRGCIVQPPVVHAGPLVRDCLGSISPDHCYPVDETSDDHAGIRTNGEIAAF
ncbi:uncharacterized protein N7511_003491 [Penicillium nucicola]|uniref:uncharacterized protein n=1 Tax=Penicillium nucicola TaxID=1850975 RepID=UPI002544E17A|nr:uncharacterized protein N7511_003491 [Penicillium nucicola]KAJ5771440.1 hypothetical protein N7511_003491 [Penicillium nucicola]